MSSLLLFLLVSSFAHARTAVTYTQDRLSALAADRCVSEMYPNYNQLQLQESDAACIIFCVLRKFKIINPSGVINLEAYRKHVKQSHQLDQRALDYGPTCADAAENTKHKQDVCKKAKVFNDCTNLYRMRFY